MYKIYFALFVFLLLSCSCSNNNIEKESVDFSDTLAKNHNQDSDSNHVVYIAIASMTSPKETHIYYNELINYISKQAGVPIFIKQKKTYEEVNALLENSEVDFAFICSGAYAEEYKKGLVKLLVAPQINDKTNYHAYIITQKNASTQNFEGFENKSFAFTDPLSNTGRSYPLKKLKQIGRTEEGFFDKTVYSYGHDLSIQMVNRGIIDGASVHGLIFDYLALHHPERVNNIKVIDESEHFGMPPVVVPKSLSEESFKRYQEIFLNLHNDSIGQEILNNLMIDKFVIVEDSIYNSVFKLKDLLQSANAK